MILIVNDLAMAIVSHIATRDGWGPTRRVGRGIIVKACALTQLRRCRGGRCNDAFRRCRETALCRRIQFSHTKYWIIITTITTISTTYQSNINRIDDRLSNELNKYKYLASHADHLPLPLTCEIGIGSPLAPSFHPAFLTHAGRLATRKLSRPILQSPTR